MVKKKTKRIKLPLKKPILDESETLVLSKNKPHLTKKLLNQIPWLKDRYLLPGEKAEDYDLRLKTLVDSIEIYNALDAIMVKDIHDEMREIHRLQMVKSTLLVDGMRHHLNNALSPTGYHFEKYDLDPNLTELITDWQSGDESVGRRFLAYIKRNGFTLAELQMKAYKIEAKSLAQVDNQMARHQKNVRESLKLIEMRRNNALVRQRLEQEIEQLSENTLEVEHDES